MKEPKDVRLERWALQSAARHLLPEERVRICYRHRVPGQDVSVWYAALVERAHYKGLMTCGSIWTCPICAAKITERRRVELTEAIDRAKGLKTILATFTLHHDRRDKLPELLGDLLKSYDSFHQGRSWMGIAEKFDIVGSVRALEVTQWINGWHPHLHTLFFCNGDSDVSKVGDVMKSDWIKALAVFGRAASKENGVDVRTAESDAAQYVAKFGKEPRDKRRPFAWGVEHELTKAPSKVGMSEHRTPTQLLRDYTLAGDRRAGELWKTYALSFKGKKQLVWSRGLRAALGLDIELTDEELAKATDEPSTLLATLSLAQWRAVLGNDLRGELLKVADSGDAGKVAAFIDELGVKALPVRSGRAVCDEIRLGELVNMEKARGRRIEVNEWFARAAEAIF